MMMEKCENHAVVPHFFGGYADDFIARVHWYIKAATKIRVRLVGFQFLFANDEHS